MTYAVGQVWRNKFGGPDLICTAVNCNRLTLDYTDGRIPATTGPVGAGGLGMCGWYLVPSPSPIAGAVAACKSCGLTNEYQTSDYECWACRNGA